MRCTITTRTGALFAVVSHVQLRLAGTCGHNPTRCTIMTRTGALSAVVTHVQLCLADTCGHNPTRCNRSNKENPSSRATKGPRDQQGWLVPTKCSVAVPVPGSRSGLSHTSQLIAPSLWTCPRLTRIGRGVSNESLVTCFGVSCLLWITGPAWSVVCEFAARP